ncbi:MAG: OmpA family protein [Ilumatobacteraceae bacterium]
MRIRRTPSVLALACVLVCSACGADSSSPSAATAATTGGSVAAPADAETAETAAPDTAADDTVASDTATPDTETAETEASTTLSDAPLDPLDDLDEDGSRDETCGTVDLGGGLVVNTLCNTALVPTPEDGVIPTAQSLLLLPAPTRWEDLADVDATIRVSTAPDGHRVVIYVLGSDTLFDSGRSAVRSTAQPPLAAIVASIGSRFPDAPIVVRGAADSVGSAASNQTLSEQRAAAVAAALTGLGIDSARITSIGLGSSVPVAEETAADGSVSEIGRQVNRRVEIVVG